MPGFHSTKRFKILVWTASIILVLLVVAYYLIVQNAESLVQRLVAYESNGKFKISVEKIRFHPFQRRIDLINISLESDHTSDDATTFSFTGDKISLQLSHIRPLIFRKQLLVDSILFETPRLKIIQQQVRKGWGTHSTRKTTLHEALGDVYVKMQNLFKVLFVKRGEINNGELTLADNVEPANPTLSLKGIYFLLEKLDVKKGNLSNKDEFMFSQNITFHTGPENIDLPDGLHHLSFSELTLNTFKRYIEINDCHITGVSNDNSRNRFDIFNKKLKLVNLDFAALYSRDIIQADSVYCLDPNLTLELGHTTNPDPQPKKINYNYDSLQQIIKMVTGNLDVHYLGIVNANINTFIAIKNKVNTFRTSHASFEVYDLNVNTKSGMPATVSRIDFALRGYRGYTPDSNNIIKFDSIRLLSHSLILWNASFSPVKETKATDFKDLHVDKFELTDVDWLDFLKSQRITARRALLDGANVKIFIEKGKKTKSKISAIDAIRSVNPSLNVQDLVISHATIEYEVKDRLKLVFNNASVEVSVRDLVNADSLANIHRCLRQLTADRGELKTKNIKAILSGISYFRRDSLLTIQKVQMTHEKGITLHSDNFFVKGFNNSGDEVSIRELGWKKAIVNVRPVGTTTEKREESKRKRRFTVASMDFANTSFSFEKNDQKINAVLNYIRGKGISVGKEIAAGDLQISGNQMLYETNKQRVQAGSFLISHDAASWIRSVSFIQNRQNEKLSASVTEIKFKPDINEALQKKYVVKDVVLESPTMKYTRGDDVPEESAKKSSADFPKIDINSLSLVQPSLLMDNTGEKKSRLDLQATILKITNIKSSAKRLDVGPVEAKVNSMQFQNNKGLNVVIKNGHVEAVIAAAHYKIEKDTTESRWQALIEKISAANLVLTKTRNDSTILKADIRSVSLSDFLAKERSLKSFEQTLRDNPNAHLSHATVAINTINTDIFCRGLDYKNRNMHIDSLSVMPVRTWEEFNAESAFQRDYIKVYSGAIDAKGVDLIRYASEKKLVIENLSLYKPVLNVAKDKRLVFQTGVIKPLPAKMMTKIKLPIFVDTVNVIGGYVAYTEISEKTNKTGVISFNKLNAWIHPLKNFDFQPTDSLRLRADAMMMDSMDVSLRIRESYTDTLSGFWMTVGIRPTEIPILNPVLEPLASVQVGSGKLDHLEMRAVGRDYISFGEMKFYYHDLKVKILKDGELEKKTFLTSMATFVANNFVIHTNNSKRDGRVFFVRNRERSIFNYWLKMTLSGVASSAGAKSNRKMVRKYKEEIKKKQLPPINLD